MNEAETRAEHIDPSLKAAGWGVVEGSRILREYHISPGRIEGRGQRGTPKRKDNVDTYASPPNDGEEAFSKYFESSEFDRSSEGFAHTGASTYTEG